MSVLRVRAPATSESIPDELDADGRGVEVLRVELVSAESLRDGEQDFCVPGTTIDVVALAGSAAAGQRLQMYLELTGTTDRSVWIAPAPEDPSPRGRA